MNIHELVNKIKTLPHGETLEEKPLFSREFYLASLIILVSVASFGLGRLSMVKNTHVPAEIVGTSVFPSSKDNQKVVAEPLIVGAKDKGIFYFVWCSTTSLVQAENRRYFATAISAQKAGYTPATDCDNVEQ